MSNSTETILDRAWKLTLKAQDAVGDCYTEIAYELFRDYINKYTEILDPCKRCALGIEGACVKADE